MLLILLFISIAISIVLGIIIYKVIALPAENIKPEVTIFLSVYLLQVLLLMLVGKVGIARLGEIFETWSSWAPFFYIVFAIVMHELGIVLYGKKEKAQIAIIAIKRTKFFLILILLSIIFGILIYGGVVFALLSGILFFPLLFLFFIYIKWVSVRT